MRPRPTEQANGEELARGKFCLDRPDLNTSVIAKVMPKRDHIHKFGWMQYSEALPALYSYTAVCDACNAQHTRSGVIWLLEVDDIHVLAHAR